MPETTQRRATFLGFQPPALDDEELGRAGAAVRRVQAGFAG